MSVLDRLHERKRRRADRVSLFIAAVIGVGFAGVLARVAQLQLAPSPTLQSFMDGRTSSVGLPSPRGDLLDRRGRLLASTRPGARLFCDPYVLLGLDLPERDRRRYADAIRERSERAVLAAAEITGRPEYEVAEAIFGAAADNEARLAEGRSPRRYVRLSDVLSDTQTAAARAVSIRGLGVEFHRVRETAADHLVGTIVGKTGVDHDGLLGAEHAFDTVMEPADGFLGYVRDARGTPMWVERGNFELPRRGEDVRLSIDLVLQEIAAEELALGVEEADAAGGRLVLVDPITGEVLAMVDHQRNPPDAEPYKRELVNTPRADGKRRRFRLTNDPPFDPEVPPALRRNRVVEDVYEPGSTFKSFMWATAVDLGLTTPEQIFDTHDGSWTPYGRRVIEDVTPKPELSWSDVLVFSSNIGMVQGVAKMTEKQARDSVVRFGFGSRTGLSLPGEAAGLVTSQKNWSRWTQTSVAMGYEVAVTPVQMARAFSVFARDGELAGTLPTLTLRAREADDPALAVRHRVIPAEVAYLAREAMAKVTENMLRRMKKRTPEERLDAYRLFGKSGTAKAIRPDKRGYFDKQYNSSFVAGAPLDSPRLVILVVIDDPGPSLVNTRRGFGSSVAGPVAARVLTRSLEYMGVPHDNPAPAVAAR